MKRVEGVVKIYNKTCKQNGKTYRYLEARILITKQEFVNKIKHLDGKKVDVLILDDA